MNKAGGRAKLRRRAKLSGSLMSVSGTSRSDAALDIAENDTSYKDALFDSSLRQYIKFEYGSVEPPPGVLARVQHAIEQDPIEIDSPARRNALMLRSFLLSLRRALSRQVTGKLLPGGVAIVIALGAYLTATTNALHNANSSQMEQLAGRGGPAPTSSLLVQSRESEQTGTASLDPGLSGRQAGDSGDYVFDQYDLHTPPKKLNDNYYIREETAKNIR